MMGLLTVSEWVWYGALTVIKIKETERTGLGGSNKTHTLWQKGLLIRAGSGIIWFFFCSFNMTPMRIKVGIIFWLMEKKKTYRWGKVSVASEIFCEKKKKVKKSRVVKGWSRLNKRWITTNWPLKTSLNSPGGAWMMKFAAMRTWNRY